MVNDNYSFGEFDFELDPEIQKQYDEIMASAGMGQEGMGQDPMQAPAPELSMPEMQFQPQQDMPDLTGMQPTPPEPFLDVNQQDISQMASMPNEAANVSTEDLKAKLRERLMQRLSSYDPAKMEAEKQAALKEAEPGTGREIASVIGSALMGGAGKVAFADLDEQTRKKKAQIEGQYGVKQSQYDKDMDSYNELQKLDATERLREIQSAKMVQDMKASELDLMLKKQTYGDVQAARDPQSKESMFARQTVKDVFKINVPESASAVQLKPYMDKAPNLMIEKAKSVASFENQFKLQELKNKGAQQKEVAKESKIPQATRDFKQLSPENQEVAKSLAKSNANKTSIKNQIDATVAQLNDPELDDDQKITIGRSLLKTLNSTQGADAIGVEEAKRLGNFLEFKVFNLTQPGSMFGRDIDEFTKQAELTSQAIGDAVQTNQQQIDQLYKGSGISRSTPEVRTKMVDGKPVQYKKTQRGWEPL